MNCLGRRTDVMLDRSVLEEYAGTPVRIDLFEPIPIWCAMFPGKAAARISLTTILAATRTQHHLNIAHTD